jgi:hypothetical protein
MKTFSKETKQKMSLAAKSRCTQEWRNNKANVYRTKIDDELLKQLYQSGKTQQECALALEVTGKVIENAMKRLEIKPRKAYKINQWGENNSGWKGSNAGIVKKHTRIYRRFGQPSKCEVCGTTDESKIYDWANLTGNYDDPNDFKRMCRSCHCKYDNKHLNFKVSKSTKQLEIG